MARVIQELDFSDANKYAWKENMPEPDLTAIINTTVDTKAAKSIINGMLLIENNGKYFNVLGQPLR